MISGLSWKVEELRKTIELLKRPEFDPSDIDSDLHARLAKAVHENVIKAFDMRESKLLICARAATRISPCGCGKWKRL